MLAVIKGAGDIASGVALRLSRAGFSIIMTETAAPTAVRRTVSFSRAVYEGSAKVEEARGVLVRSDAGAESEAVKEEAARILDKKEIAVIVDPFARIVKLLRPGVFIDAVMAKINTGTAITDAPLVIGLGPGFCAGEDCHAVIETMRGHSLGRAIYEGRAIPNTGIPGEIAGVSSGRLLRAGADGIFTAKVKIGGKIKKGDVAGVSGAGNIPVYAGIDGIVRGLLPSGIFVKKGMKAGDIDPRCELSHCFTVSDKTLSIAGGVLEVILRKRLFI